MIVNTLSVGSGAFLGGMLRYTALQTLPHKFAIFICNIAATCVLAATVGYFKLIDDSLSLFLGIGFAGAVSTWATFSVDVVDDINARRYWVAARDVGGTVTACVGLAWLILIGMA